MGHSILKITEPNTQRQTQEQPKMKTIKYKDQDGYKIITGFGQLPTDPAATQAAAKGEIEKLPEFAERLAKATQMSQHMQAGAHAKQLGRAVAFSIAQEQKKEKPDTRLIKQYEKEYNRQDLIYKTKHQNCVDCNDELVEINSRLKPKEKDARRAKLVYAECRAGEIAPTETVFADIMGKYLAKTNRQQVTTAGEIINDFRGCQYFYQAGGVWVESETISTLGADKNTVVVDEYQDQAIERAEMTVDDLNVFRVQQLTPDDRAAEYSTKEAEILRESSILKGELEIKGESATSAKNQAIAWYTSELDKIKPLYGVT